MYSLTVLDKMGNGRRWDYTRLCDEVHKRPDIDFSFVQPHHVTGALSQIPVLCKKCGYGWITKINYVFNCKTGCARCSGNLPWTLQRLLTEGSQRWPTVDFSRLREGDIGGSKNPIEVGCRVCGKWRQTCIGYLVSGNGCPRCSGCEKWDYERFQREIVTEYYSRYYFGDVRPEEVYSLDSPFWIFSYECGHRWQTSVAKIRRGTGCITCCKNSPWSFEELMLLLNKKHPSIDTSLATIEEFRGNSSKFTLRCREPGCGYVWNTTIVANILNQGSGCPLCVGKVKWTYKRLIQELAPSRPDIDFSLVKEGEIIDGKSKITLRCMNAGHVWTSGSVVKIKYGQGCPVCNISHGERTISDLFTRYNVPFEREVILPSLPRKRYDFRFVYNNRQYLLEFDGEQHFTYNDFHHRDEAHFCERQSVDILKTQHAYQNNYFLIRIDYTQIDNIQQHLHAAIISPNTQVRYLSNPEMYSYLFKSPVCTTQ